MSTEEAKQLIQELEKLRCQTRRFRLLTFIVLLVIVIAGVSAIIESAYSLTLAGPRQEEFVRNLNADLKDNVLPTVQKIAGRSVEALKPAVEKELKEINGRAPEVADVALRELDEMGSGLTVQAGKILDQTIAGTLQKRQGKLRQMYPDVYDKQIDTLLNNLNLEAQDQLAQSGENIFNPHLNSIQSILTNLDKIQKTEPVDASQSVDSWQVAFMFMDVFVHEFKDLDSSSNRQRQVRWTPGCSTQEDQGDKEMNTEPSPAATPDATPQTGEAVVAVYLAQELPKARQSPQTHADYRHHPDFICRGLHGRHQHHHGQLLPAEGGRGGRHRHAGPARRERWPGSRREDRVGNPPFIHEVPDYLIGELPVYRKELQQSLETEYEAYCNSLNKDLARSA